MSQSIYTGFNISPPVTKKKVKIPNKIGIIAKFIYLLSVVLMTQNNERPKGKFKYFNK